jgi:hypothetical protein
MLAVQGIDGNGRRVIFRSHGGMKIALGGKHWMLKLLKAIW